MLKRVKFCENDVLSRIRIEKVYITELNQTLMQMFERAKKPLPK